MPTVYINCYPTYSSNNHQTARDLFFDKKLAIKFLSKSWPLT